MLDKQGNFYTENLRAAKQTVRYTLKGGGVEVYEPHFTFQGFRYVAVDGYPGELTPDSLTGIVVHSDMAPAGTFETSKPLINQLQHNIVWGQKGNFVDVPTDCPQRDERLGWTGDAQVFARTAAFNMDVAGFFTKWLRDVAADQLENGSVPHVIPDVLSEPGRPQAGSAAWADAAVIIPWTMYLSYGDRRILETQYPSMAAWVEYMRRRAGDDFIWSEDFTFGDWLAFASTASDYPGATTGKDLIATAMFAHSTDLLQRTARVLGKADDAARYGALLERIKAAFQREFVTATGRVGENTQTAYAVALQFDLLPEPLRAAAAGRLAQDVRQRKHLTTGFVGTPYLCHVLSRYGYLDEAYLLLNREQYPSWLYPVKQGATTIWERWDGLKPDGTFPGQGHELVQPLRLRRDRRVDVPRHGGHRDRPARRRATSTRSSSRGPGAGSPASAPRTSRRTAGAVPRGRWTAARSSWPSRFHPTRPPRSACPGARLAEVTEGGRALAAGDGITSPRQDGPDVVVEAGSGLYRFSYTQAK